MAILRRRLLLFCTGLKVPLFLSRCLLKRGQKVNTIIAFFLGRNSINDDGGSWMENNSINVGASIPFEVGEEKIAF